MGASAAYPRSRLLFHLLVAGSSAQAEPRSRRSLTMVASRALMRS